MFCDDNMLLAGVSELRLVKMFLPCYRKTNIFKKHRTPLKEREREREERERERERRRERDRREREERAREERERRRER